MYPKHEKYDLEYMFLWNIIKLKSYWFMYITFQKGPTFFNNNKKLIHIFLRVI